jgi:protein phosphatase PTC1
MGADSDTISTADATPTAAAAGGDAEKMPIADGNTQVELIEPKSDKGLRRVLYTANVGDARAVLW